MAYTYDDFMNQYNQSGIYFSPYDLNLAQSNPSAGMSLLSYKNQYNNAQNEADRLAANAGANQVRSNYGNYTGGSDGSQYNLGPVSPQSFQQQPYQSAYSDQLSGLLNQQLNYGNYQFGGGPAPEYNSQYSGMADAQLNKLLNRDPFAYNVETDPLYAAYRKQYNREGQRASANALGQAASATGGIPSSYANTASEQAGHYYSSQLTDKIPELYKLAYDQYLQEYQMMQGDLSAAQSMGDREMQLWQTLLGQYNRDRDFDYGTWMDGYNILANNYNTVQGADNTAYGRFANERDFGYNQLLDTIGHQQNQYGNQVNLAGLAAQYGDLSKLGGSGSTPRTTSRRAAAGAARRAARRPGSGTAIPRRRLCTGLCSETGART